jgi:hypothetical protein
MLKLKSLFIGQFSDDVGSLASSAAGDIVQNQILNDIDNLDVTAECKFLSMAPNPCWPKGPIFKQGCKRPNGEFISYVNLPVIKSLFFSWKIFSVFVKFRPNVITQYNSYFFENIMLLLLKFMYDCNIVCIVQDIRVVGDFSLRAKINDTFSSLLLKYFSFTLPVSEALAQYLNLKKNRYNVFEGGVTRFGFEAIKEHQYSSEYAVYAGALEKYNGVDKLIKAWCELNIQEELHIFGSGSLKEEIEELVRENKYVTFHGLVSQDEVLLWQKKAKFNFCLRYDKGLNQDFFFPSKFFNVSLCPGLLIFNDFNGLPSMMRNSPGFLGSDFSNIKNVLKSDPMMIHKTAGIVRTEILTAFNWSKTLDTTYNIFSLKLNKENLLES